MATRREIREFRRGSVKKAGATGTVLKPGKKLRVPKNLFPGSSVAKTDMFGANYTPYEKKLFKKTKRPLRNGPR